MIEIKKDSMFFRFSAYGFLKNLRFFEPFILLIFLSYGLTFFQIGVLYSIRDIATNFLEIPTGIVADAFGRRRAMVSAFVCYLLSFIMLYFLEDYLYLILAMILFAFGEAFRSGTIFPECIDRGGPGFLYRKLPGNVPGSCFSISAGFDQCCQLPEGIGRRHPRN
jgi:MFS family permease